jgi:isopentenyl diphosphate isomerase/L-lactate dehydrogenase-like FMN-dependent dehydrogenase
LGEPGADLRQLFGGGDKAHRRGYIRIISTVRETFLTCGAEFRNHLPGVKPPLNVGQKKIRGKAGARMSTPVVSAKPEVARDPASAVASVPAKTPKILDRCQNIGELREAARRRLPRGVFEFFDRGSEDEASLRGNREAFARIKLRNKVLVDVSRRSMATSLFNKPMSMPLAIAPTGVAGVCWFQGEAELARAAATAGVPFTLATPSVTSIETIAAVEGGRKWFQLYMWRERELSYALVKRAQDAGFEALILTVDTPAPPIREYNRRNGFSMPFQPNLRALFDMALHPRWLATVMARYLASDGMPKLAHYPQGAASRMAPGVAAAPKGAVPNLRGDDLTWDDVRRLRDVWKGPLMIKGVHLPEDAARAVEEGLDAVIVSNHGGRNLDSSVAPIEVLPEIAAEVGGRIPVLLDSGVRRGGDVVKALALGASAVLSGRPALYGLSVAGEAGALHAISLLRREIDATMAFTGSASVADIGPRAVWMGPSTCK